MKIYSFVPIAVILLLQTMSFNFVDEINIRGVNCQQYQLSGVPIPNSLADCHLRSEDEFTTQRAVEYDDTDYTTYQHEQNYNNFHFFILSEIPYQSKTLDVSYRSYNSEDRVPDTHEIYIKNFKSNSWELLNSRLVLPYQEGNLDFSKYLSRDHISSNREIWIMTKGNYLLNTDHFEAKLQHGFSEYIIENTLEV